MSLQEGVQAHTAGVWGVGGWGGWSLTEAGLQIHKNPEALKIYYKAIIVELKIYASVSFPSVFQWFK